MTDSKISVGNLKFRPFNCLILSEIYAEDLQGDTLLSAQELKAHFNLWKILDNHLQIHSVELDDFTIHVSKANPDSVYNFQFLIDAFTSDSKPKEESSSSLSIEIDEVLLKKGTLSYDIDSEICLEEGLIDFNHILLSDLQAEVSLKSIDLEKLNVGISNLSFKEKSGFELSRLKADVRSKNKKINLKNLVLIFPDSELEGEASVDYTGLDLATVLEGADYSLKLSSGKIHLPDFRFFYPDIAGYPDEISLKLEGDGQFPQINLSVLQLNYGTDLVLDAEALLKNYEQWKTSTFVLNLKDLDAGKALIDKLTGFSSGNSSNSSINIPAIRITGEISGSIPDFKLDLDAKSDKGDLKLNGTGGYFPDSGNIDFDLGIVSDQLDLKYILSDTIWGNVSLQLTTKGNISGKGRIDASASGDINGFDFRGYHYRDITLDGSYRGDSIIANVISKDPNLFAEVHASANLEEKNPSVQLVADIGNLHLANLNLIDYQGAKVSALIRAQVSGFDPERMHLSASIDDLLLKTSTGSFEDTGIQIAYNADRNSQKDLNIKSKIINVRSKGEFTFAGVDGALKHAFPVLFPAEKYNTNYGHDDSSQENFNLMVALRKSNTILPLLGIETEIPDSAFFTAKYNQTGENLNINGAVFCLLNNETDTLRLTYGLANNQNNLGVTLGISNGSQQLEVNGALQGEVEFVPVKGQAVPDMNIAIKPTSLSVNGTSLRISPAQVFVKEKRYEVQDFTLSHSDSEYLKINGVISESENDEISLKVKDFQLTTVLAALKNELPLSGVASGEILAKNVMARPVVMTRQFTIDSIAFAGNSIGMLNLSSIWNTERQGLALRAALSNNEMPESVIRGFVIPAKDSLTLTGDIKGLKLAWLDNYLKENIYGLGGELRANFKAVGSISNPDLTGTLYLENATAGVKMLNTLYHVSDSVQITSEGLNFKRFAILDSQNKAAIVNGQIQHRHFSDIIPALNIRLDDFMVLDNANQTDSLFYGTLRLSGQVSVSAPGNDWLVQGNLRHGKNNTIMVNIPYAPVEAQRYSNITFINTEKEEITKNSNLQSERQKFSLPMKLNLSVTANPDLTLGAIYNPSTGDLAQVKGTGSVDFTYDLNSSAMTLLGNYEIGEGTATLSLKNITKKTFKIEEGGKLTFPGDPLKTKFDVTAIYSLRADLMNLDSSFGNMSLSSTKIPVNCVLSVSGELDNMQLGYNITLPNQSDEVKRKLEGILYTEDIKIKQLAYLLALGSFMPGNDGMSPGSGTIWTSLASSSITNQLNNLLAGVLSDNWSIGTDLYTNDSDFSQVEMDVNISTHLFENRLTINTTLGYNNNATQTDNFTGDFDLEYKLTSNGNVLLRFYNVTNNQYYQQAKTTQGLGVVYKREAKTFRDLFGSFRTKVFPRRLIEGTESQNKQQEEQPKTTEE